MYINEDEIDLAYEAAEELERAVSGLSWDLMTPPERRDVIAVLEQLSDLVRGLDDMTYGRLDKLAALEPGAVKSGDETIDMTLADPDGMDPADARRIVSAANRSIERIEEARAERQSRSAGREEAGTHSNPPACYVRPPVAAP
ncbi:hypothetical protein [Millisia brevis]|uniref:hypothetical protein n=1 Tax=Millisia brevis TaxID=264148 RepID=UPI0008376C19|nr:hypothetical protein [Millisia brevis]